MWNLNCTRSEIYKTATDTDVENRLVAAKGRGGKECGSSTVDEIMMHEWVNQQQVFTVLGMREPYSVAWIDQAMEKNIRRKEQAV